MTKQEQRDLLTLYTYHRMGMIDTVARGLSALIRSARTERSMIALRKHADILEVTQHSEYLDCMAQIGV